MGISKGKKPGPRRLLLYANHGVGKSTFASSAPNPVFIDIEEGTKDLDVARWDEPVFSYTQFFSILEHFRREPHDFQTLVLQMGSEGLGQCGVRLLLANSSYDSPHG